MILAALTASIDAYLLKIAHQWFCQRRAEPFRFCPRQLNAGERRDIAACDTFAHKRGGCITPERLDMFQPGGGCAFLVPCANVG